MSERGFTQTHEDFLRAGRLLNEMGKRRLIGSFSISPESAIVFLAEKLAEVRDEALESAAVRADGLTLSREGCGLDGGCRHAACVTARQIAFEIRCLKSTHTEGATP